MNLGKKISAWFNSMLCFLFGHTQTNVCERCGKYVGLKDMIRPTLEDRINAWWKKRKKKAEPEFKGSLKIKAGLKKYSINLKTNELMLVDYIEEKDGDNKVISRKAKYDPLLVYIDAMNDEVAIRKANNYLFGIKQGVTITYVTTPEMDKQVPTTVML
jgi:hypothetical protein